MNIDVDYTNVERVILKMVTHFRPNVSSLLHSIENLDPYIGIVIWSVDDFREVAHQKAGENWREVYDEHRFPDSLKDMIRHHEPEYGITWDTIDVYVENCRKDKKKKHG